MSRGESEERFDTFTHSLIDSVGKINGDIVKAQKIGPLMQSSKWGYVSDRLTELRDLCTSASGIYDKIDNITGTLQDLLQLAGTSANRSSGRHGESIKLIGSIFQIRKEVFRAYCLERIRRGSDGEPDMSFSSQHLQDWAKDEIIKKGESLDELPALKSVIVKANESGDFMVVNNRESYLATLNDTRTLYNPEFTPYDDVFPEADRECLRTDIAEAEDAKLGAASRPPPALPPRGAAAADGGGAAAARPPPPQLPMRLGAELPPRRAAAVAAAAAAAAATSARIPPTIPEYGTDGEKEDDDDTASSRPGGGGISSS